MLLLVALSTNQSYLIYSVGNEEDERIKITLHGGGINIQVSHLQSDKQLQ